MQIWAKTSKLVFLGDYHVQATKNLKSTRVHNGMRWKDSWGGPDPKLDFPTKFHPYRTNIATVISHYRMPIQYYLTKIRHPSSFIQIAEVFFWGGLRVGGVIGAKRTPSHSESSYTVIQPKLDLPTKIAKVCYWGSFWVSGIVSRWVGWLGGG